MLKTLGESSKLILGSPKNGFIDQDSLQTNCEGPLDNNMFIAMICLQQFHVKYNTDWII